MVGDGCCMVDGERWMADGGWWMAGARYWMIDAADHEECCITITDDADEYEHGRIAYVWPVPVWVEGKIVHLG